MNNEKRLERGRRQKARKETKIRKTLKAVFQQCCHSKADRSQSFVQGLYQAAGWLCAAVHRLPWHLATCLPRGSGGIKSQLPQGESTIWNHPSSPILIFVAPACRCLESCIIKATGMQYPQIDYDVTRLRRRYYCHRLISQCRD